MLHSVIISQQPLQTNIEDVSHAHIVFSIYKLLTSAKDTNDLSIGFNRDRTRRQRELNDNKNKKKIVLE